MDEEKRGGQSYSYRAVGGLGMLDKMRLEKEENKGVTGKRGGGGGGIYVTLQSEKQMEGGECVSSKSRCFCPPNPHTRTHRGSEREREREFEKMFPCRIFVSIETSSCHFLPFSFLSLFPV